MPRNVGYGGKGKSKSRRQVAHLMGSNSPLTAEEKKRLRDEIRSGKVKVRSR